MQNIYKMKKHTLAVYDLVFYPLLTAIIFSFIYLGIDLNNDPQYGIYSSFNIKNYILATANIALIIFLIVLRTLMIKERSKSFIPIKIMIIIASSILVGYNIIILILIGHFWVNYNDLFRLSKIIIEILIIAISAAFLIVFSISKRRNWTFYEEVKPIQIESFNQSYLKFILLMIIPLSVILVSEMINLEEFNYFRNELVLSFVFDLMLVAGFIFLIIYFNLISEEKALFRKKMLLVIVSILLAISAGNALLYGFLTYRSLTSVFHFDALVNTMLFNLAPIFHLCGNIFFVTIAIIYLVKISKKTTTFWPLSEDKLPVIFSEIKKKKKIFSYIDDTVRNMGEIHLYGLSESLMIPERYLTKKIPRWISKGIIQAKLNEFDRVNGEITLEKLEEGEKKYYSFDTSSTKISSDTSSTKISSDNKFQQDYSSQIPHSPLDQTNQKDDFENLIDFPKKIFTQNQQIPNKYQNQNDTNDNLSNYLKAQFSQFGLNIYIVGIASLIYGIGILIPFAGGEIVLGGIALKFIFFVLALISINKIAKQMKNFQLRAFYRKYLVSLIISVAGGILLGIGLILVYTGIGYIIEIWKQLGNSGYPSIQDYRDFFQFFGVPKDIIGGLVVIGISFVVIFIGAIKEISSWAYIQSFFSSNTDLIPGLTGNEFMENSKKIKIGSILTILSFLIVTMLIGGIYYIIGYIKIGLSLKKLNYGMKFSISEHPQQQWKVFGENYKQGWEESQKKFQQSEQSNSFKNYPGDHPFNKYKSQDYLPESDSSQDHLSNLDFSFNKQQSQDQTSIPNSFKNNQSGSDQNQDLPKSFNSYLKSEFTNYGSNISMVGIASLIFGIGIFIPFAGGEIILAGIIIRSIFSMLALISIKKIAMMMKNFQLIRFYRKQIISLIVSFSGGILLGLGLILIYAGISNIINLWQTINSSDLMSALSYLGLISNTTYPTLKDFLIYFMFSGVPPIIEAGIIIVIISFIVIFIGALMEITPLYQIESFFKNNSNLLVDLDEYKSKENFINLKIGNICSYLSFLIFPMPISGVFNIIGYLRIGGALKKLDDSWVSSSTTFVQQQWAQQPQQQWIQQPLQQNKESEKDLGQPHVMKQSEKDFKEMEQEFTWFQEQKTQIIQPFQPQSKQFQKSQSQNIPSIKSQLRPISSPISQQQKLSVSERNSGKGTSIIQNDESKTLKRFIGYMKLFQDFSLDKASESLNIPVKELKLLIFELVTDEKIDGSFSQDGTNQFHVKSVN